jgi:hypothetical protein
VRKWNFSGSELAPRPRGSCRRLDQIHGALVALDVLRGHAFSVVPLSLALLLVLVTTSVAASGQEGEETPSKQQPEPPLTAPPLRVVRPRDAEWAPFVTSKQPQEGGLATPTPAAPPEVSPRLALRIWVEVQWLDARAARATLVAQLGQAGYPIAANQSASNVRVRLAPRMVSVSDGRGGVAYDVTLYLMATARNAQEFQEQVQIAYRTSEPRVIRGYELQRLIGMLSAGRPDGLDAYGSRLLEAKRAEDAELDATALEIGGGRLIAADARVAAAADGGADSARLAQLRTDLKGAHLWAAANEISDGKLKAAEANVQAARTLGADSAVEHAEAFLKEAHEAMKARALTEWRNHERDLIGEQLVSFITQYDDDAPEEAQQRFKAQKNHRALREWQTFTAKCRRVRDDKSAMEQVRDCDVTCQEVQAKVQAAWDELQHAATPSLPLEESSVVKVKAWCRDAGCPSCPAG